MIGQEGNGARCERWKWEPNGLSFLAKKFIRLSVGAVSRTHLQQATSTKLAEGRVDSSFRWWPDTLGSATNEGVERSLPSLRKSPAPGGDARVTNERADCCPATLAKKHGPRKEQKRLQSDWINGDQQSSNRCKKTSNMLPNLCIVVPVVRRRRRVLPIFFPHWWI